MLWQVWIILHSWIFCWLLPIDCFMICLHLRVKQSQSFSQGQTFYSLPSAPSCCLHITDTSSPSISDARLFTWLGFSVYSVSIILRAGCVSAARHRGMWMCVCAVLGLRLHVVDQDMVTGVQQPWESEWGCNWDSWVNGSELWEWRCWQGEVIPVLCQVRHWKCQCAAKACHPFIMSDEQIQSPWIKLKPMFYYLIILVSKLRQKSEVINSCCSIGIKCNQKFTCICFSTYCWDMDFF